MGNLGMIVYDYIPNALHSSLCFEAGVLKFRNKSKSDERRGLPMKLNNSRQKDSSKGSFFNIYINKNKSVIRYKFPTDSPSLRSK